MTPHKVPEGHDHFYGFSRWSKECMPYDYPDIFYWTDIDCIFPNPKTGEIHLIEIKLNNSPVKPYQRTLLETLEKKGVIIHFLRMVFNQKYYGDHDNLGDPRLADKIILDGQLINPIELEQRLCSWHGINKTESP